MHIYSDEVKALINKYNTKSLRISLVRSPVYQKIVNETGFLSIIASLKQRTWHILNNTKEIPKCPECGDLVNWSRSKSAYRKRCSTTCSSNSKEVQDKYKSSCLKRFKVDNPQKSKVVRARSIQTCLELFNARSPLESKEVLEKIKQTNLERIGVGNPFESKEIQKKIKQTNLNIFGFSNPMQSEEVKSKGIQTNLKNHGGKLAGQQHLSEDTIEKVNNKDWLMYEHHVLKKTLIQIAEELIISLPSLSKHFQKYKIKVLTLPTSDAEQKIVTYIKSIYSGEVQNPNRKVIGPKHLDIYLPDINLALEFNGIRWHSTEREGNGGPEPKEELYHFNKSGLCFDQNIGLIHIFENEWQNECENIKYWLKKCINQDQDFITKDILISDLKDQLELNLSRNWPINVDKLEELGYELVERLDPVERMLSLNGKSNFYKIYDCGRVVYKKLRESKILWQQKKK